jgi:fructose-1,6-bisphosphatase/inositol monophosphatase family enzyme
MSLETTLRTQALTVTKLLREAAVNPEAYQGTIEWKKKDDPVTFYDKHAESLIREALAPYGVAVTGEEFAADADAPNGRLYIDPIDSTKSFVRGGHGSAMALGLEQEGKITLGAVGDILAGVLYFTNSKTSERIDIYTEKSRPLTARSPLSKPLLATNDQAMSLLEKALEKGWAVQTAPGVALNLALVATGNYDAFVTYPRKTGGGPSAYDIAGGIALCQAAGVELRDLRGEKLDAHDANYGMVAAWPEHLEAVQALLAADSANYLPKLAASAEVFA